LNWTDRDKIVMCIVGAFGLAVILFALIYTLVPHGMAFH